MDKYAHLLERAGELKVELGEFVMGRQFREELDAFIGARLAESSDEHRVNTLIDKFVLQVPLKRGHVLEWLGLESAADFDPYAFDVMAADARLI